MEATNEVAVVETEKPTEEAPIVFDEKACEELFALAKRNLLCGEVPNAVSQLQDVCKQLATKYGETAPECADAYFQYGVALLELARMENRVLGNALTGMTEIDTEEGEDSFAVPTVMTEEEKEKISEQVIEAMLDPKPDSTDISSLETEAGQTENVPGTDSVTVDATTPAEKTEGEEKKTESSAVTSEELKPADGNGEPDVQKKDENNEDADEDGEKESEDEEGMEQDEATEEDAAQDGEGSQTEDEDVSNLQLSWEMLELAKTIYQKQDSKEAKLKTAECLKKLGEVGLESEQYTQSIEDFISSLEILKTCVEDVSIDRRLAETHYHIGVACVNAQQYDDAVTHFRDAITILEAKIVSLNAVISSTTAAVEGEQSDSQEVIEARKELKELDELIPEIKLKIDDAEEEKKSVDELKKETSSLANGVTTTGFDGEGGLTSSDSPVLREIKPVSDVSHLVRKKRKPEDDNVQAEGVKKSKISETDSGVGDGEADVKVDHSNENDKVTSGKENIPEDSLPEKTVVKTMEEDVATPVAAE